MEPSQAVQILIVEDNEDARDCLKVILEQRGYGVSTAGSGAEALEALRMVHATHCIVLLDMILPDMNGLQVARAIHRAGLLANAAIILCTGWARAGIPVGCAGILRKPYRVENLLVAVARTAAALLQNHGSQHEADGATWQPDA